jgi:hypothetical protein
VPSNHRLPCIENDSRITVLAQSERTSLGA